MATEEFDDEFKKGSARAKRIDRLIGEYGDVVGNSDSKPERVADLFLQIVKASLELMIQDPDEAVDLLDTIIYTSNELKAHFKNKEALGWIHKKAKALKVEEFPKLATDDNGSHWNWVSRAEID